MTLMHRIGPFAILGCLLLAAALASGGGEKKKAAFKHSAREEKIFELTNEERKKEKIPALKLSAELSKIARAHSANMARQEKMAHVLDGKSPFDRLKGAGYFYEDAGENVAESENAGVAAVMQGWMESKKHRENILNADYKYLGVGIATDAKGKVYYTQLFATPRK